MAGLTQIRKAIATTIKNGVETQLYTYDTLPDNPQMPCAIIEPTDANFDGAMTQGMDTWYFHVYILCARGDASAAQRQLDQFITGGGVNSVRRALYVRPDLNLDDGTDCNVTGMMGYGGSLETVKVPVSGAVLRIKVITDGRA